MATNDWFHSMDFPVWPSRDDLLELALIPMGAEHGRIRIQNVPPPPPPRWRPRGVTWALILDLQARIARIEELRRDPRYSGSYHLYTELFRLRNLESVAYHWYTNA